MTDPFEYQLKMNKTGSRYFILRQEIPIYLHNHKICRYRYISIIIVIVQIYGSKPISANPNREKVGI
jgi:hypothetical protein